MAYLTRKRGSDQLYVVNADGTHRRLLTRGVNPSSQLGFFGPEFSWAPDGRRIVFVSSNGLSTVTTRGEPALRHLSFKPPDPQFPWVWEPTWSGDGSRIACTTQVGPKSVVAVMRADGSDLKVLTPGNDSNGPVWSHHCYDAFLLQLASCKRFANHRPTRSAPRPTGTADPAA